MDNYEEHQEIAWLYYMPIWAAVLITTSLYVLHGVYKLIIRQRQQITVTEEVDVSNKVGESEPTRPFVKKRLVSLDTFRCTSLALMIFVNFGGGEYWFFDHIAWDGLALGDLVMPWFVFMAGVSIRFGIKSRLKRAPSKLHIVWEVLVRTVKLSCLGIFVYNGTTKWSEVHIPGVLQRIALGYCVVSLIHLASNHVEKGSSNINEEFGFFWIEHLVVHLLLIVFICITYLLPVPGCPTGYTGPGGISESAQYNGCGGGAAPYIDQVGIETT